MPVDMADCILRDVLDRSIRGNCLYWNWGLERCDRALLKMSERERKAAKKGVKTAPKSKISR